MHALSLIFVLTAWVLDITSAQPAIPVHKRLHRLDLAGVLHQKRQIDWNNPSLYAGVDWKTVNYGNAGSTPPAATPAPAAAPASKPAPAPAPKPAQTQTPAAAPAAPKNLAVAPVQSSAPSVQPAPSTNTQSGSGKRGLAYDNSSPNLNIFDGYGKITWAYNWGSSPGDLPSKFEYVPLCFKGSVNQTDWMDDAHAAIGRGSSHLMSFNEPDMPAQANMAVADAVLAFNELMKPLATGNIKIGSPAVSNGVNANQGLNWLTPFLQQCTGCPIHFVPVHWYGCTNSPTCTVNGDVQMFKKQMQDAMNAAVVNGQKVPIWITEFQTHLDEQAFLAQVLPWLDSQPQVERYSYFMASSVSLTSGNAVSPLGQKYAAS